MKFNLILIACFFYVGANGQQSVCSSPEKNTECAKTCSILANKCRGFTFWNVGTVNYCFLKNFTRTPQRAYSNGRVSCVMINVWNGGGATTYFPTNCWSTTLMTTQTSITTQTTTKLSTLTTITISTTTIISTTTPISTTTIPGTTTVNSLCTYQTGAYYGAPANAFDFQNANSVGDCCNLCKADGANCAAFSYITDQKMCYIYSAPLNSPEVQPNTIGGIPN